MLRRRARTEMAGNMNEQGYCFSAASIAGRLNSESEYILPVRTPVLTLPVLKTAFSSSTTCGSSSKGYTTPDV